MSQDLLAEFGSFSTKPTEHQSAVSSKPTAPLTTSSHTNQPQHEQPSNINDELAGDDAWADGEDNEDDDDDDFGDFEAAGEAVAEDVFNQESNSQPEPPAEPPQPAPAKKAISAPDFKPNRSGKALSSSHPFAGNLDVLFDAESDDLFEKRGEVEEEEEDDDFGDFETTAPAVTSGSIDAAATSGGSARHEPPSATFDLLGLDDEMEPSPTPRGVDKVQGAISSIQSKVSSSTRRNVPQPRAAKPKAHDSTSTPDDDFTAWDDFEVVPAQEAPEPTKAAKPTPKPETDGTIKLPTELLGDLTAPAPESPAPAPTNIPPPSLLLTLFPPLFRETSTHVLHPLASLSPEQKHAVLGSADARTFLKNHLVATHVLAHVIAGRKNRWKRDKYLAQSMRIGPSVSGRSGGMKLAGLDLNESRREDAEVEDVLKVWREQLGRLKSAVTGAAATLTGESKKALAVVPELASVMPVRIARQEEGGIVSTAACALCGLKREERVAKVDVEVEDSFGEWWVEKTNMHLKCFNFWDKHKERLRGR